MKRSIMMLMLCICTALAFAQQKGAGITVDISPLKTDSIWVDAGSGKILFMKAGKDGKYTMHFAEDFPKSVRIGIDKPKKAQMFLFLENGNQLNIKTDFDQNTTFSGKGAENARVLHDYMRVYINTYTTLDAKNKSAQEYYDMVNSMEQKSIDMLEANKQKVTRQFYDYQSVALKYQKIGQYIMLPFYFSMGFGKKFSEILPSDYWELDQKVQMDEKLLSNKTYSSFINGSYPVFLGWREMFKQGKLDSNSIYTQEQKERLRYSVIEKYYPAGKIRKMALSSSIGKVLGYAKDVEQTKPLMEEYIAKHADVAEAKTIKDIYEKRLLLSAGKVPPFFILKDLAGKDVTLKDFAGKVIYIDFWASWCSPCRQEMQNGSPKLHAKFKDNKDVVFLYISIDSKEEPWKKAIIDDKIEGIHLLSLGGTNSVVAKAFAISGIPRYVIIGKDGKIFDNDAPRPSQDVTPVKINEALNAK